MLYRSLVVLGLLFATPVQAATYYFQNPGGSDGAACSQGAPCLTLAKAASVSTSGDTINLVRGSVWREAAPSLDGRIIQASGSGSLPTVSGAAVLAGTWTQESANVWFNSTSIANDPIVFFHDGIFGTNTIGQSPRKTTKVALAVQWDYFYDSGNTRLYVYSTADPSTLAATLEYGSRQMYFDTFTSALSSIDSIYFYGARGGSSGALGILGFNNTGTVIVINITNSIFGPSGGQAIQFSGTRGSIQGNTFIDWNVSGQWDYYAIQSIAASGMTWPDGMYVKNNVFILNTVIPHSLCSGSIDCDRAPTNSDVHGWIREVSGNTMYLNGFSGRGPCLLVFQPDVAMLQTVVDRNRCYSPSVMCWDFTDLTGVTASVLITRNYCLNADQNDTLDTEGVRFRTLPSTVTLTFNSNVIDGTKSGSNAHPGIGIQSSTATLRVWQNTIVGADAGIEIKSTGSSGVDVQNNILASNRGAATTGSPFATNNFNDIFSNGSTGTVGANSITNDPQFGGAFNEAWKYRVPTGSPAVAAGQSIGVAGDFGGAAFLTPPAMGAWQFPSVQGFLQ